MTPALKAEWLAPGRTAVLVVDMQADFGAPQGALGQAGADLASVPAALAAAERLAGVARAAGAPLIFVGLETTPETDSPAWSERGRRLGAADMALCRRGEEGARFIGPTPLAGERVVAKTRYSAFFATDLDAVLRSGGVDTLVVCGLTTECCVDQTVRDAFQLDYQVFLAADACAAYDSDLHATALRILELNCAILTTVGAIAEVWRSPA